MGGCVVYWVAICFYFSFSGSEAGAVGLHPGQCVLKVNGNNVMNEDYTEVLEHFSSFRNRQQEFLVSCWVCEDDGKRDDCHPLKL